MRADAFRRADDRAQVVRVGDAVQQHQQRFLAALRRALEHLVHRRVFNRGDIGDHPLMRRIDLIQPRPVDPLHHRAGLARQLHDVVRRARQVARRDQQLLHRPARAQRLSDGIAAAQQVAVLRQRLHRRRLGALGIAHRVALLGIGDVRHFPEVVPAAAIAHRVALLGIGDVRHFPEVVPAAVAEIPEAAVGLFGLRTFT